MKLLTKELTEQLLKNGRLRNKHSAEGLGAEPDFLPVVKLFTPDAQCMWLLSEIDPDDPDIAFGLCDLGMGFPELGNVSLTELATVRGRLGLPVERDRHFTPNKSLSGYASDARQFSQIRA